MGEMASASYGWLMDWVKAEPHPCPHMMEFLRALDGVLKYLGGACHGVKVGASVSFDPGDSEAALHFSIDTHFVPSCEMFAGLVQRGVAPIDVGALMVEIERHLRKGGEDGEG